LPLPTSWAGSFFLALIIELPWLLCEWFRRRAGVGVSGPCAAAGWLSRWWIFLERVQHVQDTLETHRVDGSISISVKVVANLQNSVQTLQWLGVVRMLPDLRFEKGLPDPAADGRWKSLQVLSARAHKTAGLILRSRSFTV
jgi:hypothetical protein